MCFILRAIFYHSADHSYRAMSSATSSTSFRLQCKGLSLVFCAPTGFIRQRQLQTVSDPLTSPAGLYRRIENEGSNCRLIGHWQVLNARCADRFARSQSCQEFLNLDPKVLLSLMRTASEKGQA